MQDFQSVQDFANALYAADIAAGRRLQLVPYIFPTTFAALVQNATATNALSINANADFICLAIRHRAQIGAAQTFNTKTAPYVRMLITDSGTGEQWTYAAVDLENQSANGPFGLPLPFPRWVGGKTALSVQVTNYAPTAETYTTLDVALLGVLARII